MTQLPTLGKEISKVSKDGLGDAAQTGVIERAFAAVKAVPPFVLFAARRFQAGGTLRVAASLSYTSLLSLVPLMVICLAMLAAFPAFEGTRGQLETFVYDTFVPHAGSAVKETISGFVDSAGKMTAVGVLVLAVTAIMLLATIEEALNKIFRVKKARTLVSKLIVYWTVLTLGPMLIGASFSLSGYLFALTHWAGEAGLGIGVNGLTKSIPMLLALLAFSLLYLAVPNRRVTLFSAFVGGLGAALLFGGLRYGFTVYVTNSTTYQTIYGALAALPIFLIWIYLSWGVVLFGAEMAASVPEWKRREGLAYLESGSGVRLRLALEAISAIRDESCEGRGLGRDDILERTGAPEGSITPILESLSNAGFVAQTEDEQWIVVRDLELTSLHQLVKALGLGIENDVEDKSARGSWREVLHKRLAVAEQAQVEAMDMPLSSLLSGDGERASKTL